MRNLAIVATLLLAAALHSQAGQTTPVLLELFTSEGCSSCPPADRLLQQFDHDQPVAGAQLIVLSEHVDYWNHLGWSDPFSSSQFSQRQEEYAARLGTEDVYTPQLIVDGSLQAVGSNRAAIEGNIKEALAATKVPVVLHVSKTESAAEVEVQISNVRSGSIYVALAANQKRSEVKRGENAGRQLSHVAVVSSLRQVGKVGSSDSFHGTVAVPLESERIVVFVQDPATKRILGAAQTHL